MNKFHEDFPTEEEQAVVKLACESSLKTFIKLSHYYIRNCKFTFLDFHDDVIKALEDRVLKRTDKNLLINMPVGYGKSSIIQGFIPWGFARCKHLCFLYTSYSGDLIQKHSGEIKDVMQSDFYNTLWNYKFKNDAKSKSNWSIEGGIGRSGLTAGAMGGTITGLDAGNPAIDGFCGAMVIDDPLKATDAIFENSRLEVIHKYEQGLKTRLRRADVPTIVIMQRLHEEDLSGFIMNEGKYREGKTPEEINAFKDDWDVITVKALVNEKSTWEEKVSTKTLITERNNAPWVFYPQRQQEPGVNVNTQFKGVYFEEEPSRIYNGLAIVDKSFGGSDSTALCIGTKIGDEYILFGKKWNKHIDLCINEINLYCKLYRCGTVYTETNDDKGYTAKNNKTFAGYHESMNKHFKIMTYLYSNWKNVRWLKTTDPAFINQIQVYQEKAVHDDCPDSAASLIRLLEGEGIKAVKGIVV